MLIQGTDLLPNSRFRNKKCVDIRQLLCSRLGRMNLCLVEKQLIVYVAACLKIIKLASYTKLIPAFVPL